MQVPNTGYWRWHGEWPAWWGEYVWRGRVRGALFSCGRLEHEIPSRGERWTTHDWLAVAYRPDHATIWLRSRHHGGNAHSQIEGMQMIERAVPQILA